MEELVIEGSIGSSVSFEKLKKEHFNVKWIYVLKSTSLEEAQEVLVKAAGSNKLFFILDTVTPVELGLFYSVEDLSKGLKLYAFVLKNGLFLDSRGIYKRFLRKDLGQIQNEQWAIYKRPDSFNNKN